MAQTPEAKVKAKIKAILKEHGVYYAMPIGTGLGNSGVPDFLCCVHGSFIAIEAKAGKGKLTALQVKNLTDVMKSKGIALVINEINLTVLEEILNRAKNASERINY